ncbi:hypothetical protein [Burkholderia sp. 3C]
MAGANAQAGVTWAENEALNNTESTKSITSSVVQSVLYGMMPWLPGNPLTQAVGSTITSTAQGVMSQIQANYGGQTPPADASNQLANGNDGGNNTPPTATAVVTPAPCPVGPGACGVVVSPIVTPGAPILSSGNGGGDSGSGSGGQGSATNTADGSNVGCANTTIGRSIPNSAVGFTRDQFEQSLSNAGFTAAPKGGANDVTVYTNGNIQYTVRNNASSTGGPSVDYCVNGNLVSKIRLNGQ